MSALRPFEAAARHENFSTAAEELFVTQAAISKQIRLLEIHLGVSLFTRRGKNLELTAAGRDLHHAVAQGLNQIAGGSDRLRPRDVCTGSQVVWIVAVTTGHWVACSSTASAYIPPERDP